MLSSLTAENGGSYRGQLDYKLTRVAFITVADTAARRRVLRARSTVVASWRHQLCLVPCGSVRLPC